MKHEFSREIFDKYSSIKFHENPSNRSRVRPREQTDGPTDRQTWRSKESIFAILRTRLKAEMPLKFTAEVTVKVSGIREAGERNRSIERIMADVNQPSDRGKEQGQCPPVYVCSRVRLEMRKRKNQLSTAQISTPGCVVIHQNAKRFSIWIRWK